MPWQFKMGLCTSIPVKNLFEEVYQFEGLDIRNFTNFSHTVTSIGPLNWNSRFQCSIVSRMELQSQIFYRVISGQDIYMQKIPLRSFVGSGSFSVSKNENIVTMTCCSFSDIKMAKHGAYLRYMIAKAYLCHSWHYWSLPMCPNYVDLWEFGNWSTLRREIRHVCVSIFS